MKLIGFMGMVAVLLLPAIVARAGALPLAPQVGDTYEITLTKDSVQQGSHGSSGSSHDKDTIIERVIGLRADGLELQYDLPNSATADERARNWHDLGRVRNGLRWKRAPPNEGDQAGYQWARWPVRDRDRYTDAGAATHFTTRLTRDDRFGESCPNA